jgi:hypothetical protein
MKPPVSLDYAIAVVLLAATAAVLSFVMPHPAFNLAALLLGIYALHLVSLRVVIRMYVAGGGRPRRGKASAVDIAEIREMREQLEQDRREFENRKTELEQRIAAAEQQWELLRGMIRERVEGGTAAPNVAAVEEAMAENDSWTSTPPPSGPKEPTRIHGRW